MQSALVGEPHLSTLEQISPQPYIRFILCFGLSASSTHYEVIQILRQGLKEIAAEVPILNSLVVLVCQSGMVLLMGRQSTQYSDCGLKTAAPCKT